MAVLYEGRQIYFGPTHFAKQYFIDLGYHCPERQTTADFLTSLTNPAERIVQPGAEGKVPKTPEEFARIWESSETRQKLLDDIEQFGNEFPVNAKEMGTSLATSKAQQTSWTSVSSYQAILTIELTPPVLT